MTKRLEYIDRLKGLAIILVVMGHVLEANGIGWENGMHQFIYLFHMPLFFFLSGLLFKFEGTQTVVKKSRQLLVPLMVWGCLLCFYNGDTLMTLISDLWKSGYWYLWVLFEFYLIYSLYSLVQRTINKKNKIYLHVTLFLLIYVLLRNFLMLCPQDLSNLLSLKFVVSYFPYVYLGWFLKNKPKIITFIRENVSGG